MAISAADPSARNDVELGSVTHWPTVYAAAGVAAILVVGLLAVGVRALCLTAAPPEAAEPVAEVRPTPPHFTDPVIKPTAPVETSSSESPSWKPLVPHTPPPPPVAFAVKQVAESVEVVGGFGTGRPTEAATRPSIRFQQRLDLYYDDQLLADLRGRTAEIDLDAVDGTVGKLLGKAAVAAPAEKTALVMDLIANRPDLAGLPVRGASECRLPAEAARREEEIAQPFHCFQPWPGFFSKSDDPSRLFQRNDAFLDFLAKQKKRLKEESVPVLTQILQIEGPAVRLELTRMLASISGRKAGAALAQRALFDLSPDVRGAAVQALKDRPSEEYRQALLDGFRYPWPPVADHAAEALTAVGDRDAAKSLEAMVDLPDPSAPVLNEKKKWVMAEMVKVNHLRNCLLCHAPSSDKTDPMRGLVPKMGEELPERIYERGRGDFVRADVTYLRQDFSVVEHVEKPNKWPDMQRFDYLIRQRELTDQEIIDMADDAEEASPWYPQRKAVRYALEKLTAPEPAHPVEKAGLGP